VQSALGITTRAWQASLGLPGNRKRCQGENTWRPAYRNDWITTDYAIKININIDTPYAEIYIRKPERIPGPPLLIFHFPLFTSKEESSTNAEVPFAINKGSQLANTVFHAI